MTATKSTSFRVRFTFSAGWCRLYLDLDGHSEVYKATSIATDAFGELAHAVATVASGALIASALWGDEPGGVFIDLARCGPRYFGLVLHGMHMSNWILPEEPPWTPVRGAVLVNALIPLDTAFREFYTGIREARGLVSENGRIKGWGYPFPDGDLQLLSRRRVD